MTTKNWFESRGLRVLDYQQKAIADVQESIGKQEITVLAACPSAGKTIMAINIIADYLYNNPTHKILVEKWKTLRLYCDRNNFPLDGVIGEIIGAILFIMLIWWWLS